MGIDLACIVDSISLVFQRGWLVVLFLCTQASHNTHMTPQDVLAGWAYYGIGPLTLSFSLFFPFSLSFPPSPPPPLSLVIIVGTLGGNEQASLLSKFLLLLRCEVIMT